MTYFKYIFQNPN